MLNKATLFLNYIEKITLSIAYKSKKIRNFALR